MKQTKSDKILLFLKGLAMGTCDIIPGVSGGTIALISGIYDELLKSISQINTKLFKLVISKDGFKKVWTHINGKFLFPLGLGLASGVLVTSRIIIGLINAYPIMLWSFFLGLICFSSILILLKIKEWNAKNIISLLASIAFGYYISIQNYVVSDSVSIYFVFFSGFLAICAMILPGISGSFILLLLGSYHYILSALNSLNLEVICVFLIACVLGLLIMSRFLSYMLKNHQYFTLSALSGVMIGSLGKIWPWKINKINNVSPFSYHESDPQIYQAVIAILAGMLFIWFIHKINNRVKPLSLN